MAHSFLKIHSLDNVVVALHDLEKGKNIFVDSVEILLRETIPAKHKIYIQDLEIGGEVRMYGVLIGKVTKAVVRGELMSTQNLKHAAEPYSFRNQVYKWTAPDISKWKEKTFMGRWFGSLMDLNLVKDLQLLIRATTTPFYGNTRANLYLKRVNRFILTLVIISFLRLETSILDVIVAVGASFIP
jgi:hypothetical protein